MVIQLIAFGFCFGGFLGVATRARLIRNVLG